jgi:hypothetical protein
MDSGPAIPASAGSFVAWSVPGAIIEREKRKKQLTGVVIPVEKKNRDGNN